MLVKHFGEKATDVDPTEPYKLDRSTLMSRFTANLKSGVEI